MSKTTTELPYTEIFERVVSLGRVNANAFEKVRGVIQDIATRDIPTKHDWTFLIVSSGITTVEEYKTGLATATTDSRIVTVSADATLTDAMVGRKIKLIGNEVVYQITSFIAAQSIQILPPMQGDNNLTSVSYTVFQDTYPLAPDFDRFPKDGGIYKWTGGRKEILPESPYQEYAENYTGQPSIPNSVRLVGMDTAGNPLVEFTPPPSVARAYGYDYIKRLPPLVETTAGFIKGISSNVTTVDGQPSARFQEATTSNNSKWENYFFRIDALGKGQDSVWFPVINVADNSALTLRNVFANTAITSSANYTISKCPEMPTMLHPAVLYGSLAHMLADQGDASAVVYFGRYAQVLSDAKRIFVSRVYSQDIHGIHEDWDYRR